MKTIIYSFITLSIAVLFIAAIGNRTITGKVTDDQGAPLAGVSIYVKHSKNAVQSDINGNYSIIVSPG